MTDPEKPTKEEQDAALVFAVIIGIIVGYLLATINVQLLNEITR